MAGFVLAGGKSSRMGRDKALISFAGRPLIVHALEALRAAGLSASIAGGRSLLDSFAPVVTDARPGAGPLGGICAALASCSARRAVFLPVDQPFIPASLLEYLIRRAATTECPITLASVSGFAQTFPAVVDRAALPVLESELEAGRRGCYASFQAAAAGLDAAPDVCAVEWLVQAGQVAHPESLPALRWFLNANSPQDLDRAEWPGGHL